jgi:hypothetical protein
MTEELPDRPARERQAGPPPGMPRWVKAFIAVGVLVAVLLLVQLVAGGGGHGPGRHSGVGEVPAAAST